MGSLGLQRPGECLDTGAQPSRDRARNETP